MFYRVDEIEGRAEVYGRAGKELRKIDPHDIFPNRWIGYDNIRRNVLVSVLDRRSADDFCRYLRRKFPEYEKFAVLHVVYPSNLKYPGQKLAETSYVC
jgi:hypothetical protein